MKRMLAVLAVALSAVLVGCGDGDDVGGSSSPTVLQFGETHTFPNGAEVTVWAFDCRPLVGLQVTVVNNTAAPVDPSVVGGGTESGQKLDTMAGDYPDCDYPSLAQLFPGESVTYVTNVRASSPRAKVRIEVWPPASRSESVDWGDEIYFTGTPVESRAAIP